MNPLLLAGPLLLAQDVLLDLAGRGLGELGELHGGGGFEAGDVLLAEVYDLLLGRLLPLLEGHESFGPLAPLFVRHRGDGGLHNGRMAGDDPFHLDRRDVLSAGDDDVLVAVPDLDVAVRMPHGDVARVVPAALERLLGRFFVVEVAFHDHVAVHDDLAHRLAVERYVVHLVVHDAHQVRGNVALALPRQKPGVLLGVELLPLLARGARGHRTVGLGQAVEVQRPDVQLQQLAYEGGRRRGTGDAGDDLPFQFVGVVMVGERDLYRRRRAVVGYALRFEELPDPARFHLPQTHVRPRDRGHGPGVGPAVAVEHGERPQVFRLVAHPRLDDVAEGAQVSAAVRVHHPLGPSRRPRGVVHGDHLLLVLKDALQRPRRAFGQVVLVGVAPLPGVVYADAPDALVHALQELLELVVHKDHLRLRVLDDVLDLTRAQPRVYGDEDQPSRRHGEGPLEHRRGVGAKEGDAVALAEALVPKARSQAVDPLFELSVRVAPPA